MVTRLSSSGRLVFWQWMLIATLVTFAMASVNAGQFSTPVETDAQTGERYRPGRLIVRFHDNVDDAGRSRILNTVGGRIDRYFDKHHKRKPSRGVARPASVQNPRSNIAYVRLDNGQFNVSRARRLLRKLSAIAVVEPDYITSIAATPNDTLFDDQWNLHNTGQMDSGFQVGTVDSDIDAPEAWDDFTGTADVVVAIVDTGLQLDHEDLDDNLYSNTVEAAGTPGSDDDVNGFIDDIVGWDFVNDDNDPYDDNGHGTGVAGIIGAEGNNGVGIAGVNWEVSLMPLKALSASGSGTLADILDAVTYIRDNNILISNHSYTFGTFSSSTLSGLIDDLESNGALFIAAAGNGSSDNDLTPSFPSSYGQNNIIAVAGTDNQDNLYSLSNYGTAGSASRVDLCAAGNRVYTTWLGGLYVRPSGTSFAAPHVAGAAALIWGAIPAMNYSQVRNRIFQTVRTTDIDDVDVDCPSFTDGILNLDSAVGTLPVSLSWFTSHLYSKRLLFEWASATETQNVGYDLWIKSEGEWIKVSDRLIASRRTNALSPSDYRRWVRIPEGAVVESVGLMSHSTDGEAQFFGPFETDQRYGENTPPRFIQWSKIRQQVSERLANRGYVSRNGSWSPMPAVQTSTVFATTTTDSRDDSSTTTLAETTVESASANLKTRQTSKRRTDKWDHKGPVVNVSVAEEGVYRISYEMLKQAGVSLFGAPSKVIAISRDGKSVGRYVHAPKHRFGTDSYIDFYATGAGPVDADYTHDAIYTVQLDSELVSVAVAVDHQPTSPATVYRHQERYESENHYNFALPGDDPWYASRLLATARRGASEELSFDISADALTAKGVHVRLGLIGVTDWPGNAETAPDHHLQIKLASTGSVLADIRSDGLARLAIDFGLSAEQVSTGDNRLEVHLPGDTGFSYDLVFRDYFEVSYIRPLAIEPGQALLIDSDMITADADGIDISGLDDRPVLAYGFDGESGFARLHNQLVDASGQPHSDLRRYPIPADWAGNDFSLWVAQAVDVLVPDRIDRVSPTMQLEPLALDLAIIAHPAFLPAATELDHPLRHYIAARRSQGYSVELFDLAQIYSSYSDGLPVPRAINEFIRQQTALAPIKHLLIVGGDSYDYHDYTGAGALSFVPAHYRKGGDIVNFSPSDDPFTDLNADGFADIATGRWPVRSVDELSTIVNKTLAFESYHDVTDRSALLIAEANNDNEPSYQAQLDRISAQVLVNTPLEGAPTEPWNHIDQVYLHALIDEHGAQATGVARDQIRDSLAQGPTVTLFSGHGAPDRWSYQNLVTQSFIDSALDDQTTATLASPLSCYTTYWVTPKSSALGHALLFSSQAGAVAVHGAATLSRYGQNEAMTASILNLFLHQGVSLGSAVNQAKNEVGITFPEIARDWVLLGDPLLKLSPR